MFIPDGKLKDNYQRLSTNRFVVDSPRFWRKEFHPRFKDVFTEDEIRAVIDLAKERVSYELGEVFLATLAKQVFKYISGQRFSQIVTKNPEAPEQFLADLYGILADILPAISFKDYKLIQDDFNLVTHRAETGKNDTAKVATEEANAQKKTDRTAADILSEGTLTHDDSTRTENIDNEGWQNNKTIADTFLSPQNSGVQPTTENIDPTVPTTPLNKRGVNGIPNPSEAPYTTNTVKQNFGESNKSQSNTSGQAKQSTEQLRQNNDIRTAQMLDSEFSSGQSQENTIAKNDNYVETLDFDRGARLQAFYDLVDNRLVSEIYARLSRWFLLVDIATSETNYNECPVYE